MECTNLESVGQVELLASLISPKPTTFAINPITLSIFSNVTHEEQGSPCKLLKL